MSEVDKYFDFPLTHSYEKLALDVLENNCYFEVSPSVGVIFVGFVDKSLDTVSNLKLAPPNVIKAVEVLEDFGILEVHEDYWGECAYIDMLKYLKEEFRISLEDWEEF